MKRFLVILFASLMTIVSAQAAKYIVFWNPANSNLTTEAAGTGANLIVIQGFNIGAGSVTNLPASAMGSTNSWGAGSQVLMSDDGTNWYWGAITNSLEQVLTKGNNAARGVTNLPYISGITNISLELPGLGVGEAVSIKVTAGGVYFTYKDGTDIFHYQPLGSKDVAFAGDAYIGYTGNLPPPADTPKALTNTMAEIQALIGIATNGIVTNLFCTPTADDPMKITITGYTNGTLYYTQGTNGLGGGGGGGSGDFKADGSVPMTGDFNGGGFGISNFVFKSDGTTAVQNAMVPALTTTNQFARTNETRDVNLRGGFALEGTNISDYVTNAVKPFYETIANHDSSTNWMMTNGIDGIIYPSSFTGGFGTLPAVYYGGCLSVLASDTDGVFAGSFYVRRPGVYKPMIVWTHDATLSGKTMSGKFYVEVDSDEIVQTWNAVNGVNWDLPISNAVSTVQFSLFSGTVTNTSPSHVGVYYGKDDNCGGAAGCIIIYQLLLVRQ